MTPELIDPQLLRIVAAQPYPLLFATISGAHLHGFPSPDSDFDLRGAHLLPVEKVVGLEVHEETLEDSRIVEGLEMDIVTHDARKFFGLLLKKNGYVLEQLFSPLIVQATAAHAELKAICAGRRAGASGAETGPSEAGKAATGVVTRHHAHHYFGFAETQWKLFLKESPRRVKPSAVCVSSSAHGHSFDAHQGGGGESGDAERGVSAAADRRVGGAKVGRAGAIDLGGGGCGAA